MADPAADPRLAQLRAAFSEELDERVRALNQLLLRLERDAAADPALRGETLDSLFREAHSLKGAARAVTLPELEHLAHALESALDTVRHANGPPARPWFDAAYRAADAMSQLHQAVTADAPMPRVDDVVAALLTPADTAAAPTSQSANSLALPEVPSAPAPAAPNGTHNGHGLTPHHTPPSINGNGNGHARNGSQPALANGAASDSSPAPAATSADRASTPPTAAPLRAAEPRAPTAIPSPAPAPRAAAPESVRVAVEKLDLLLAQAGELTVTNVQVQRRLAELRSLRLEIRDWRRLWRNVRVTRRALQHLISREMGAAGQAAGMDRDAVRNLSTLLDFTDTADRTMQQLVKDLDVVLDRFDHDAADLNVVSRAVQDEVMAVRLLPVGMLFGPLERLVRDLTREQGKEARLVVEHAETELDRKILEQLRDPLMHMVRNAVDHGMELPDERERQGKPREATLRLSAGQRGGTIEIVVADDGRGMDPARLRETAVRKGVLSPEQAAALDDRAAFDVIFLPGFSTTDTVSETSGRGVGMDVVRANVERLNGQIFVVSTPGQGTRFTLSVPLTLATMRTVLVEQSGHEYAIPSSSVERTGRVRPQDLVSLEGRRALRIGGHPVPVAELGAVLDLPLAPPSTDPAAWRWYLVLEQGERRLALLTDALTGEQEIVVKSLSWPLRRVRNVTGAAVLGSGHLAVILNPTDLLRLGLRLSNQAAVAPVPAPAPRAAAATPGRRRKLLVVDDSLTTRTLERSILEAAGYEVEAAEDGLEALGMLRDRAFDLVVSDVQMPRLDGFGLTAEIRRDERLRQVPVVLVTSLASPEYQARGVAAGADAYIVKSGFDQAHLLETVGRLL